MGKLADTRPKKETAVLVSLITQGQSVENSNEFLDELAFLAETYGLHTVHTFSQKLTKPDIRTFVGKGKLEEIHTFIKAEKIDIVIFDDDLSPSQLRNLERDLKCRIYDRSLLILEIFLKRAQTAQAKTQVELARYQYLMPRLTRMWTHLERQRGGTGTRGGAGEKEIETDRRIIRNQIGVLKKKLAKIEKQSYTQRKSRSRMVRVALVGYTNVGKSTLMRLLTKADILAEDKLFATVDATVRKIAINNIPFLLSDTVGFIRKLPHHLIESFKSTLAEIEEADVLLHVVDISHRSFQDHMSVVNSTLSELGVSDKKVIVIFNKIDQYRHDEDDNQVPLEELQSTYLSNGSHPSVFISAKNKTNIDKLRKTVYSVVKEKHYAIFPNFLKNDYEY